MGLVYFYLEIFMCQENKINEVLDVDWGKFDVKIKILKNIFKVILSI